MYAMQLSTQASVTVSVLLVLRGLAYCTNKHDYATFTLGYYSPEKTWLESIMSRLVEDR